eukprot:CAMPEP_0206320898 /NCGR_PEP_ID=MMETSP0106_2-20121207/18582_1 /ASSEMBLY_ACC=CAM_ASM_000206 /TAXON_ID=81532 /ORGANISM="Acanthoeca-like sp., Strain 10tr" /LENGTH=57 /DNA_ID=CAMNT_0053752923 /DNA_START=17 /DNA_END=186 /DNA_ORIENTATION=+
MLCRVLLTLKRCHGPSHLNQIVDELGVLSLELASTSPELMGLVDSVLRHRRVLAELV